MIDNPNKEESFISEHPKSQLEIVQTDYRPMVEVVFSRKTLENIIINLEEFIAIKGIKALGNQLTADKIRTVDMLDPLPYEAPVIEEVEVTDEEIVDNTGNENVENESPVIKKNEKNDKGSSSDEDGQITLF